VTENETAIIICGRLPSSANSWRKTMFYTRKYFRL